MLPGRGRRPEQGFARRSSRKWPVASDNRTNGAATVGQSGRRPAHLSSFFLYSPSTTDRASSWFSFASNAETVAVSFSTFSLKLNS